MAQAAPDIIKAARARTNRKLRLAGLMLRELRAHGPIGDDFDVAHEEAILFHLMGSIDAFLQEVNLVLALGLATNQVTVKSVRERLKRKNLTCTSFQQLDIKLADKTTWAGGIRELRHHVTHIAEIPKDIAITIGGKESSRSVKYALHGYANRDGIDRLARIANAIADGRGDLKKWSESLWKDAGYV